MGGGGGRRCVPSGTHANHTPLRRGRQISKEKERETERDGMEEEKGQPGGRGEGGWYRARAHS